MPRAITQTITGHCTTEGAALTVSFDPEIIVDALKKRLEKRLGKKGIGVKWSDTAESADVSVRFVEIDKGNQFLRYMLPFIAPAVVEVEGHVSPGGSAPRSFHFVQKAQVGLFGGGAKSMLTVCANVAADKIAKEILKVF